MTTITHKLQTRRLRFQISGMNSTCAVINTEELVKTLKAEGHVTDVEAVRKWAENVLPGGSTIFGGFKVTAFLSIPGEIRSIPKNRRKIA